MKKDNQKAPRYALPPSPIPERDPQAIRRAIPKVRRNLMADFDRSIKKKCDDGKMGLLERKALLGQEAFVPISDRGFLFGEGMFTTIRVSEGKCELLPCHLRRLQQQAKALELSDAILQLKALRN